ncbi:hypothetical protein CYY_010159 [Polysphondylium violaceum]|uniref:Importin subunit alpha n=1 Tax=Polysphondylium violaceum TaxID=133409 RepID=A0A8J4PS54_9MYCE|nr:hypothetical protein CYY_010159 [Polysphondylium violaceum]
MTEIEQIDVILTKLHSNVPKDRLEATVSVRKVLSIENEPPINEVINFGIVPILHSFLQDSSFLELQFEASWALTNIASGSSEQVHYLIQHGVIHTFLRLVNSPNSEICEQCIWGLGNIIGDSSDCRDLVLKEGITDKLIQLLSREEHKVSLMRNIAWTFSNMCRGSPRVDIDYILPLFPIFKRFLASTDTEIVVDTLWAISFISEESVYDSLRRYSLIEDVFQVLKTRKESVFITPAFRVLGNLLSGDDLVTEFVLNCGVLDFMHLLLKSGKASLMKEGFWMLSNITSGTLAQITRVLDKGLIRLSMETGMNNSTPPDVKKEILWVVLNAINGGDAKHVDHLVTLDVVNYLNESIDIITRYYTSDLTKFYFDSLVTILRRGLQINSLKNPYILLFKQVNLIEKVLEIPRHTHIDLHNLLELYHCFEDDDNLDSTIINVKALKVGDQYETDEVIDDDDDEYYYDDFDDDDDDDDNEFDDEQNGDDDNEESDE